MIDPTVRRVLAEKIADALQARVDEWAPLKPLPDDRNEIEGKYDVRLAWKRSRQVQAGRIAIDTLFDDPTLFFLLKQEVENQCESSACAGGRSPEKILGSTSDARSNEQRG